MDFSRLTEPAIEPNCEGTFACMDEDCEEVVGEAFVDDAGQCTYTCPAGHTSEFTLFEG